MEVVDAPASSAFQKGLQAAPPATGGSFSCSCSLFMFLTAIAAVHHDVPARQCPCQ